MEQGVDMPKILDLKGKKFGKLTVLKKVYTHKKKGHYWLCQCDCYGENSKHLFLSSQLVSGKIKSCGCLKGRKKQEIPNLTGKKFGLLKVLRFFDGDSKTNMRWVCQCSCKAKIIKIIRGQSLLSGNSKSCGCIRKEKSSKFIIKNNLKRRTDLSGEKYGHLLVLQEIHRSKNYIQYLCKCDCGNIIKRGRSSLLSNKNNNASCGCAAPNCSSRRIDISNQIYGRLKAIKRIDNDKNNLSIWLCECECGNKTEVRITSLLLERTKSCGCLKDPAINPIRAKGFIKMQFGLNDQKIKKWMVDEKMSILKLKRNLKKINKGVI